MKDSLLVTLALICYLSTNGQMVEKPNAYFDYTYDKDFIKNQKVKTISSSWTTMDGLENKTVFYFDKKGYLLKEIISTAGEKKSEFLFFVNEMGDLSKRIMITYPGGSKDSVFWFQVYRNKKLVTDSSSILPFKYLYEYDDKGLQIKRHIVSYMVPFYTTNTITDYLRDGSGKIIHVYEISYESTNASNVTVRSDRKIIYDIAGHIIEEQEKINRPDSWMVNKGIIKYKYDDKGNLVSYNSSIGAAYLYERNAKGLITAEKMIMNLDGNVTVLQKKYQYTFWK